MEISYIRIFLWIIYVGCMTSRWTMHENTSALVSRSSLWSALALRKPNERELRFCEKSRA
jgi:hypothetical protein